MLKPVMAAEVSKADLAKMEKEVEAQNLEHKKLQAQATSHTNQPRINRNQQGYDKIRQADSKQRRKNLTNGK